jgi:putative NADH-flavin reductase
MLDGFRPILKRKIMNVLVFGASGGTGRELVTQGVELGHTLSAFVRNPAKFEIKHPKVKIIQGDVVNARSVDAAVRGHDAVISALGASTILRRDPAITGGVQNIIRAMEDAGVLRFIYLSALVVRAVRHQLNFFGKYVVVPILGNVAADHEANESAIARSRLDWTIVRPPRLTNGARTGTYRSGEHVQPRSFVPQISRADLAEFMLSQLTEAAFVRKAECVMY